MNLKENLLLLFLFLFFNLSGVTQINTEFVLSGDQVELLAIGIESSCQWQESSDNISWSNIDGATENTYIFVASGTSGSEKYYRVAIEDNSCGEEELFYSSVIHHIIIEDISELEVGDFFRGGKVYNYTTDGLEKRIASAQDDTTGVNWGCPGVNIHTTYQDGQFNTTNIISECSDRPIAASVCSDSELNGYSDWYLPSSQELYRMNQVKDILGGFDETYYWTSTEDGAGSHYRAWSRLFNINLDYTRSRNETDAVRCIRPFLSSDITRSTAVFEDFPTIVSIISQPEDLIVCDSATASFSVVVEGTEPITYQWFLNDQELPDFTQNTLNIDEVSLSDEGIYRCEISNACGTVSSENAELKVLQITVDAGVNDEVCDGTEYNINASAFSNHQDVSGTLQYNWTPSESLSQVDILNPVAQPTESTTYSFVVTDEHGCSVMDSFSLAILEPVSIITQPISQSICNGEEFSISVICEGSEPITYQWQKGGDIITDAIQNNFSELNCTTEDEGLFSCEITNVCGSVISENAEIKVITINVNAGEDLHICPDSDIQLEASVISNHPEESGDYNWLWIPETGLSSSTIYNPIVSPAGYTEYSVNATDQLGCIGEDMVIVSLQTPFDNEQICVVSVDTITDKAKVFWEKTAEQGSTGFNIYRNLEADVWELAGFLPFDEPSVFIDQYSQPEYFAEKYKIAVVDSCGNESEKSYYHSTILLEISAIGNDIDLSWNLYEDEANSFVPDDYHIYRGLNPSSMQIIDILQGENSNYLDEDVENQYYYRISAVRQSGCNDTDDVLMSFSNTVNNPTTTHKFSILPNDELIISPNPFSNHTTIYFNNDEKELFSFQLSNSKGQIVKEIKNINTNSIDLQGYNLTSGVYIIYLESASRNIQGKVVVK